MVVAPTASGAGEEDEEEEEEEEMVPVAAFHPINEAERVLGAAVDGRATEEGATRLCGGEAPGRSRTPSGLRAETPGAVGVDAVARDGGTVGG